LSLDSHIHHPGESKRILTAIYTSALWGLWHYPLVTQAPALLSLVLQLLAVQILVGVPLSIWWRKSGNLFVTGLTHALLDTVRNVLFAV
jgi:membrane protease YdiL (CAAX protease family)